MEFDRYPKTGYKEVKLMAATAVLSDVQAPAELRQGDTGHIKGYATNTSLVNTYLVVDLVDVDTGSIVATVRAWTIPQAPYFSFDLTFTMPNRNFRWYLSLHD